jgi:hypothetical protein
MNDFLQSLRNGQAEKQRPAKTRKSYDNSYHYSTPRYNSYGGGYQNTRSQQMKRPQAQPSAGNQMPVDESSTTAMLAEAIETLCTHIETLAKNQDYLVSVHERTADMLERQAIAIERIVDHLNIGPAEYADPEPEQAEQPFRHHYVSSQDTEIEPQSVEPPAAKPKKQPKAIIRKRKKIVTKKAAPKPAGQNHDKNQLMSREEIMDIIHTMRAEGATFDQVASRLIELGQPTFSGRGEWHAQTIHRLCNKK